MIKLIWIPLLIITYILSAYTSYRNNIEGGKWFWINYSIALIPIWQMISKYSKDIFFDAILFDVILILSFTITLGYFTGLSLSLKHIVGLILIGSGLIIFKI